MRHLKRAIQEQQGTSTFVQQLFLLGKSSEDTREEPLGEEENIASSCTIALCVLTISGKLCIGSCVSSYPLSSGTANTAVTVLAASKRAKS